MACGGIALELCTMVCGGIALELCAMVCGGMPKGMSPANQRASVVVSPAVREVSPMACQFSEDL